MINECKVCGRLFEAPQSNYKYCSQECREKGHAIYVRKWREQDSIGTPYWVCPKCDNKQRLDYYPTSHGEGALGITCSACGYTNGLPQP